MSNLNELLNDFNDRLARDARSPMKDISVPKDKLIDLLVEVELLLGVLKQFPR